MWRLTLSQLRHGLRRLVSAGLAIGIGAAFVAATLVAGDVLDRASVEALSASFGDADLVVEGDQLDPELVRAIAQVDGVASAHAVLSTFVQVEGGGTVDFVPIVPAATDPSLEGAEIVTGTAPGPGEIVLARDLAGRLGIEVGDQVSIRRSEWQEPGPGSQDGTFEDVREPVRVAGLLRDRAGAFSATGIALGDPGQVLAWAEAGDPEGQARYEHLSLAVEDGVAADTVISGVEAAAPELRVRTREAYAADRAEQLTGDGDVLVAVGLAFGAVALLVSGLVIANTFSVVVAQRTRTLALLRCVGADVRQLRRSVLIEATGLGVLASVVGIAVGLGLAQGVLSLLGASEAGASLPAIISPGPAVFVVPLVSGLVVTAGAALVPARAASRVAPLAAMRPPGGTEVDHRAGRRRRTWSLAMIAGGLLLLAGGAVLGRGGDIGLGLGAGVLGGALSFVGVLLGAVFVVPRVIGSVSRLAARGGGATVALAAANSVRNPRRTAATSSALLIGVTLVAMMSSGAAIARASFDLEFDRSFPVDVELTPATTGGATGALPDDRLTRLQAIEGVSDVAATSRVTVQLGSTEDEAVLDITVVDTDQVGPVVRDADRLAQLGDDTVVMPEHLADGLGIDGVATLTGLDHHGAALGGGGEVRVETRPVAGAEVVASVATADRLGIDVPANGAWLRLVDGADVREVTDEVQDVVAADDVIVTSAAAERESFDGIVSTLLRVVVGLLGVAVVIALVGVANTLSLSVIERGRESATLRAIGLTRRQLRRTLAIEASFIAGAGAVLGTVLGTFYGYVGSLTVLGELADGVPLAVPWSQLVALVLVSSLAGVVASVLPARRAARTSPVAALATE